MGNIKRKGEHKLIAKTGKLKYLMIDYYILK